MTEPKKTPRPRKAAAPRAKPTANKTALGQKITDAAPGRTVYGDDVKAAARALWEGDPTKSKRMVAEEMGIPYGTIDRWSKGDDGKGEKWSKRTDDMSARAHAAADTYRGKLSELGPEITTQQQRQAEADAAEETAGELRGAVLARHRKEWNVPRALVQEAVKARDFGKAKLAKITSETLKIIQDGERKAWGIDNGPEGASNVTVVIERE